MRGRLCMLAVVLAGCRADPCESFGAQTCLALEVRWATGSRLVDQLAVRALEGFSLDARTPSVASDAFELPAVIPIGLADFQGRFRVAVTALRGDAELGSGEVGAEIPRGVHRRYTVDLRDPDVGDLLSADDAADGADAAAAPSDLAGADLLGAPSFAVTTATRSAFEHESFTLHLVALDGSGQPDRAYTGLPGFMSDWGDVRVRTAPTFVAGEADATVSLNRETNQVTLAAHVTVSDGNRIGQSPGVSVLAPGWLVDYSTLVFGPGSNSFDSDGILYPSWTRRGGTYYLFYQGWTGPATAWGTATSIDGLTWTRRQTANIPVSTSGWDIGQDIYQWKAVWDGFRFVAAYYAGDGLGFAQSGDGFSFVRRPTRIPLGVSADCDGSPLVRSITAAPGRLRVYAGNGTDGPCQIESSDVGSTWTTPLPTEGLSGALELTSLKDGSVHKLWFRVGNETYYATSGDGTRWINSLGPAAPAILQTILWSDALERYEALHVYNGGFYGATR